ncbi:Asparagine synthetase domain-containing protein OS=Streptomyces albaduncus OX=68172 GN=FHS32_004624 PE=4 SV=1 [Streptomyces griseoloalbus]
MFGRCGVNAPGARAAILRSVLEGAGVRELPAGWGAQGAPASAAAAAARTGLRVAAGSLIALFDTPLLAEAGLVEARVVRKALRGAAEGEPLPLDGLADLVALEVWLRRLLARRGTCWTGTPARQRAVPAGIAPQRGALGAAGAAGAR